MSIKSIAALSLMLMLSACASSPETTAPGQPPPVVDKSVAAAAPPSAPTPPVRVMTGTTTPMPGSLASRGDVQAFIQEMSAKHDFDPNALTALFNQAQVRNDILALMRRPAEGKPWSEYRTIFLTPQRVNGGAAFWREHQDALVRAERIYGVPAEIIVAIIGVETMYGGNMGSHGVLEALATLAFDYPRRAPFFRKELENYLVLTRAEGIDPLSLKGSYAGAMGYGQFMPSSYIAYAVDFTGDGRRDLWNNPADAIGSVASYLSSHDWNRDGPIAARAQVSGDGYRPLVSTKLEKPRYTVDQLRQSGVNPLSAVNADEPAMLFGLRGTAGMEYWLGFKNFYVITRYNHSELYAMAVYQLSQEIRRRFES